MKPKKVIGRFFEGALAWIFIIVILPLLLLMLIGAIIYTPVDYIIFKRSAYQKDFPRKYKWLCGTHINNRLYTVIKENRLPITYLRDPDDYEMSGDFIYGDTLLNFSEPFFYDKKREAWLFWPGGGDGEETDAEEDEGYSEDSTEDCLEWHDSVELIIDMLRQRHPGVSCSKVVFFYEEKMARDLYGKSALEKLRENGTFVVYEKRRLKETLLDYIKEN